MAKKGFETPSVKVLEIKPQRIIQASCPTYYCNCDIECGVEQGCPGNIICSDESV